MKIYRKKISPLAFALPSTKMLLLAAGVFLLYLIPLLIEHIPLNPFSESELNKAKAVVLTIGISMVLLSFIVRALTPKTFQIVCMVRQGLFNPARGNPLKMQEGEILPKLRCRRNAYGYTLSISAQQSVSAETIKAAGAIISSALNRRFSRYAVVNVKDDVTCNQIEFQIEDVALDRRLKFKSIMEMRPENSTKILIQQGTQIDLTTSGSILVAGKTRSGKTTGIVSLLLQVLQSGMDCYGSEVVIIDPKKAELSRLPYCGIPNCGRTASKRRMAHTRSHHFPISNVYSKFRNRSAMAAGIHKDKEPAEDCKSRTLPDGLPR